MKFKSFILIAFNELGFENVLDYLKTLTGLKSVMSFMLLTAAATATGLVSFVQEWIWDPPMGAFIILILIIADSITGAMVAMRQGEKFDFKKSYRSVPILVSHIFILAMTFHIGKIEPALFWLPNAVFGWFSTRNLMSIVLNMIKLKWVEGEFFSFLEKKFLVNNPDLKIENKK